jgi:hypothetical protein
LSHSRAPSEYVTSLRSGCLSECTSKSIQGRPIGTSRPKQYRTGRPSGDRSYLRPFESSMSIPERARQHRRSQRVLKACPSCKSDVAPHVSGRPSLSSPAIASRFPEARRHSVDSAPWSEPSRRRSSSSVALGCTVQRIGAGAGDLEAKSCTWCRPPAWVRECAVGPWVLHCQLMAGLYLIGLCRGTPVQPVHSFRPQGSCDAILCLCGRVGYFRVGRPTSAVEYREC